MGLNRENIHETLARFWQGKTTLDEEQALKEFFVFNNAPDGLEEVAEYFRLVAEDDGDLDMDFDDRVLAQIDKKKTIFFLAPMWRVAAVLAVTIGLGAWLFFGNSEDQFATNDTLPATSVEYSEQEVKEAFEQTKSALFLVSSKLEEGKEHTAKLNKFHSAKVAITHVEQ